MCHQLRPFNDRCQSNNSAHKKQVAITPSPYARIEEDAIVCPIDGHFFSNSDSTLNKKKMAVVVVVESFPRIHLDANANFSFRYRWRRESRWIDAHFQIDFDLTIGSEISSRNLPICRRLLHHKSVCVCVCVCVSIKSSGRKDRENNHKRLAFAIELKFSNERTSFGRWLGGVKTAVFVLYQTGNNIVFCRAISDAGQYHHNTQKTLQTDRMALLSIQKWRAKRKERDEWWWTECVFPDLFRLEKHGDALVYLNHFPSHFFPDKTNTRKKIFNLRMVRAAASATTSKNRKRTFGNGSFRWIASQ